jgi:hypothetical protein
MMSQKIGRNDPCWCGSGKKYKHCHMREDKAKAEPQARSPASRPPALPPLSPPPEIPPEIAAADARWDQFEAADLEEQIDLFQGGLASGVLGAEESVEMLETIRSGLDTYHSPEGRTRYADLLQQLRQGAPDLYEHHIVYYHADLINDAIADGGWDDLPELLIPFSQKPERGIEIFSNIKEQLMYHGQVQPLIDVMRQAWPEVAESGEILPWAIEEFAGDLSLLILLDYLERTESPRSDDPALLDAVAPYGKFKASWLKQAVRYLSAPAPSAWSPDDFGQAVDAEQGENNLSILLFEFMADQRRHGVPLSRSELVRGPLLTMLHDQLVAAPTLDQPRRGKKRARERAAQPQSPLVPRHKTLDKALVDLFPFLGARPFKAGAIAELLPAYLHFLARLGLIHPTQMDEALASLRPMIVDQLLPVLRSYGGDPCMGEGVETAWSEATLDALRDDPALAEARARPPVIPAPAPPPPARRPGSLQTYTFKVTYLYKPSVWSKIEIGENQTLDDLHYAILDTVDFDADHLYSFFMSGRAWDEGTEYASPHAEGPSAARVKIGALTLRMKQKFLYLFDYGDEHRFEVQLVEVNPDAPRDVRYPRVLETHGKPPRQYG